MDNLKNLRDIVEDAKQRIEDAEADLREYQPVLELAELKLRRDVLASIKTKLIAELIKHTSAEATRATLQNIAKQIREEFPSYGSEIF